MHAEPHTPEKHVVTLKETIEVSRPINEAFAYVADWETIEDWDPGVVSSKAQVPGSPQVGRAYDLMYKFGPRETPMTYVIKELVEPRRLVLTGEGTMVDAVDTIEFEESANGTIIHYTAELSFNPLMSIVTKFMGSRLDKIGEDAVAGLKKQLESGATAK